MLHRKDLKLIKVKVHYKKSLENEEFFTTAELELAESEIGNLESKIRQIYIAMKANHEISIPNETSARSKTETSHNGNGKIISEKQKKYCLDLCFGNKLVLDNLVKTQFGKSLDVLSISEAQKLISQLKPET